MELYHHGIKGMRWGIRRYQNKDGSLTDAGKKRYADSINDPVFMKDSKKYGVKNAEKIQRMMKEKGYTHRQASTTITTTKNFRKTMVKATAKAAVLGIGSYALAEYFLNPKFKAKVNNGASKVKDILDSYNNVSIMDKNGNVIAKYHQRIKVGSDFVGALIRR